MTNGLPRTRTQRFGASATQSMGRIEAELRRAGHDVIGLSQGEPDFVAPPWADEAAIKAIRDHRTRYSTVDGMWPLKEAIARKFARDNGLTALPDHIVVTSGAKMAIANALLVTIEPGDQVIVPAPHWVSYPDMVRIAGGEPVLLPCRQEEGFRPRPEELEAAIRPRTRMLILNSPGNPAGTVYDARTQTDIAAVLERHPHVLVLTDEIYEHLVYDGRRAPSFAVTAPALADRTITVNGMSKGFGMTGWRIGYATGTKEIVSAMAALQSQTSGSPNTVAQIAAAAALDGPQEILLERAATYQRRRDMMVAALARCPGLVCHAPEGAFYVYPECSACIGRRTRGGRLLASDEDLAAALLHEAGVGVVAGRAFGLSPHLRLSFALAEDRMAEALERIRVFCEALS
jgi:aspartate aminotransferase